MAHFAEQTAALQEDVFRASEAHSASDNVRAQKVNPLLTRIKLVSLPGDRAEDVSYLRAFHLYLIVAGTSKDTDQARWRNYVVTLTGLCFADLKESILVNSLYEDAPMSAASAAALMQWYETYRGAVAPEADQETQEACAAALEGLCPDLDMPQGVASLKINPDHVLDIPSIYGHYSLVLFLAGKTITEKNRSSVGQKRPAAIERKYFGGASVASLSGSLALSNAAHSEIHAAFVYLSHARKVIFNKVSMFNDQGGDPQVEVVATTTRLMRFAGMQQAMIIDKWLLSHPDGFRVPMLMPSIAHYVASLKELKRLPAEQRPYFKLIHGDTTRAFNRNDLEYLLAIALADEREVNPTLQLYAIPPNFQLIMDRYQKSLELLDAQED